MMDCLELLRSLIRFRSITPLDDGAIDFLYETLINAGFKCEILEFGGDLSARIKNLYAWIGDSGPNLCFAGHTDVVPVGEISKWKFHPFEAALEDGVIYGRGCVDMKGAIAAFISAAGEYLKECAGRESGMISLLITGDEEGPAIHGTRDVIAWLRHRNIKIDACIIGEPTSNARVGDIIKVGARGSVTFSLMIYGKQGHVAYHRMANNAVDIMLPILQSIKSYKLDDGSDKFEPSNLEFTDINIGNSAENIIPGAVRIQFNVRFNDRHTCESLYELIRDICSQHINNFSLDYNMNSMPFCTDHSAISDMLSDSIFEVTKIKPDINTFGGSSDARFIMHHCPTLEFGLLNKTAHQVDEHVSVSDIMILKAIYKNFLHKFFNTKI
ncbi:MAG: succinyl-diaminopimelate desuccinylase [Candidatus Lariskella arthropodorum]